MDWIRQNWIGVVEVLVLWVVIYQIFRIFRGTRGAKVLVGVVVVVILLTYFSQVLHLRVIAWIVKSAAAMLVLGLLIIFQPELRSALARWGNSSFFSFSTSKQKEFLETLAEAVIKLSRKRFGALFAIERGIGLEEFEKTGVSIDGALSVELVATIFHPKTALHDGGVILKKEKIAAAACIFPVSQRELKDRSTGLRHRAALGICEETDAVAVVVSEETGGISIAYDHELYRNLSEEEFREKLEEIFLNYGETTEEMVSEKLDAEDGGAGAGDRDLVSD